MELGQLLGWDAYFYSIFAQTMNMQEFTAVALRALRELQFDFFAYGMCSATPFMRPKTVYVQQLSQGLDSAIPGSELRGD